MKRIPYYRQPGRTERIAEVMKHCRSRDLRAQLELLRTFSEAGLSFEAFEDARSKMFDHGAFIPLQSH